jgi:protein-S-isoprenylcysteine O-methyltransferase Ste14
MQILDQSEKFTGLVVLFIFCIIVLLVWILFWIQWHYSSQVDKNDLVKMGVWDKIRKLIDQRNGLIILGLTFIIAIIISLGFFLFF